MALNHYHRRSTMHTISSKGVEEMEVSQLRATVAERGI